MMAHALLPLAQFELPPLPMLVAILLVIFFAIGLHEYAHAKAADLAGDPTPGLYGRVTLNLTKHFELLGTIMIIFTSIAGVGIGWGKPVPMDPRRMRNPRWDHFTAVLAGPLTNVLQAAVYAILLRVLILAQLDVAGSPFLLSFLFFGVTINLSLALFNMLPIGPLDGMWIAGTFMPDRVRLSWTRWNLQVGSLVFIGLVIYSQVSGTNLIWRILRPPLNAMFEFLTGLGAPF